MAKKRFALHNSYFKKTKMLQLPDTLLEIAKYKEEHGELPFEYNGNNWIYDAMCERQKYNGVLNSQYLTPDATAERMMHFAGEYFKEDNVLEPFCGTGQITKELIKDGYNVSAFDNDMWMVELCSNECKEASVTIVDFKDMKINNYAFHHQIICNPPYEIPVLTEFFEWMADHQDEGSISILLLPKGFIDKTSPKRLAQVIRKFGVLEKENMRDDFARTKTKAEIVVLKKL